jgi:two-component system LytT family response regulator
MTRLSTAAAKLGVTRVESNRYAAFHYAHSAIQSASSPGPLVMLRVMGRVIVVDEANIDWIDGAGKYLRFHIGQHTHRVRGSMNEAARTFPPPFVRSHRSTIINIAAVNEFVRTPFGDLIAVMRTGDRLTVGRTYRCNLRALFAVRL